MVERLPLTYAHVFPWSSRPGTAAAAMPDALPRAERQEHAARVRALMANKHEAFLREQSTLPGFVFAGDGDGGSGGINEYYAPCRLEDGVTGPEGHELLAVRASRRGGRSSGMPRCGLIRPVYGQKAAVIAALPRHGTCRSVM